MVLEPLLGLFACVGVIVLLEDDVAGNFCHNIQGYLEGHHLDVHVEIPIHPPINLACHPKSFPHYTAPHYHRSCTNLQCATHQPFAEVLTCLLPCPFLPI